jgi:hypothetical protein
MVSDKRREDQRNASAAYREKVRDKLTSIDELIEAVEALIAKLKENKQKD